MRNKTLSPFCFALFLLLAFASSSRAGYLAAWDFSKGLQGWKANGYLKKTSVTPEGIKFTGIGVDPQIISPELGIPAGKEMLVTIKMKKDTDSNAELYYGTEFSIDNRVRFDTFPDNTWREYSFFLTSPGPAARFRLDPFFETGKAEIAYIRIEDATPLAPASLKKPEKEKDCGKQPVSLINGDAAIKISSCPPHTITIAVDGKEIARSNNRDVIGYMRGGAPSWIQLETPLSSKIINNKNSITTESKYKDADGAIWTFRRSFAAARIPGAFNFKTTASVDRGRDAIHIPWITLFHGNSPDGGHKSQALFSGLEYLSDEPSSSEADMKGPNSLRRIPDPVKITFPLMAIVNNGLYAGMTWNRSEYAAAVFDSPDRIFETGANIMALWAPEVGPLRRENAAFAYKTFKMKPGTQITVEAAIIGGKGESVVPAIKQYAALKKMPAVPEFPGGLQKAVELLAHGWLDSALHEDGFWRHAVWGGNFAAQRAADAPMFMYQLANITGDSALAAKLIAGANRGLDRLAEINPANGKPFDPAMSSGVGHVRFPAPALLFGPVFEYSDASIAEARSLAANSFEPDGKLIYKPASGRPDYGSTHYENHANGLAADKIFAILNAARLYGDKQLIARGLELLDAQTKLYANTVPRGAQTWEIPLHTPDILASAYLVKSYTLAYALTGKDEYIEQARYWAWTGLPFVYLENPTGGKIGPYATIAVLGATNWESPNWIGLPVQWCGLVYASALYELAGYDSSGPWRETAKGITATGLLLSFPVENEKSGGLLPDFFHLKSQLRDGPEINPGTVQAHFAELFNKGKLHDFRRAMKSGVFITAPCELRITKDSLERVEFTAAGFGGEGYRILIGGLESEPAGINELSGKSAAYEYSAERKALILRLGPGPAKIAISLN